MYESSKAVLFSEIVTDGFTPSKVAREAESSIGFSFHSLGEEDGLKSDKHCISIFPNFLIFFFEVSALYLL